MIQMKIKFEKVTDVTEFVNEISKLECEADLSSGRYLINAKSIMGLFTLNLSNPVDLIIHSEDNDLKNKFTKWRVE